MAGLSGDRDQSRDAALEAGFLGTAAVARHRVTVDRMIDVVLGELNRPGAFDFGDRGFVSVLRGDAMVMAEDRDLAHSPDRYPVRTAQDQRDGTAVCTAEGSGRCARDDRGVSQFAIKAHRIDRRFKPYD
jgi:hypothetical protein